MSVVHTYSTGKNAVTVRIIHFSCYADNIILRVWLSIKFIISF